jgi:hypothetical protein
MHRVRVRRQRHSELAAVRVTYRGSIGRGARRRQARPLLRRCAPSSTRPPPACGPPGSTTTRRCMLIEQPERQSWRWAGAEQGRGYAHLPRASQARTGAQMVGHGRVSSAGRGLPAEARTTPPSLGVAAGAPTGVDWARVLGDSGKPCWPYAVRRRCRQRTGDGGQRVAGASRAPGVGWAICGKEPK